MTEIDLLRERYRWLTYLLSQHRHQTVCPTVLELLSDRADIMIRLVVEFQTTP